MKTATNALGTAVGVILGVGVLGLAGRGEEAMPRIDGIIRPIVAFGPTQNIMREPQSLASPQGRLCFSLELTKLRQAFPLPYRFWVSTQYSPKLGFSVYLATKDYRRAPSQDYAVHAVGTTWLRRYCGDLPGTITDQDPIVVSGYAYHQRKWWGGVDAPWLTQESVPNFDVGGLK